MQHRGPVYFNGARLAPLVDAALGYPPIDPTNGEVTWLYLVRENAELTGADLAPYVVFASGHTPYTADARFDLAYWNLANFAVV
jgi:hypothetical protein